MWNITLLWLFCCTVLSCPVQSCPGYTFFLATPPMSNPWTEFNYLWLKWRVVTQGCAFWGFEWQPTILRGSKPPKNPQKGGWLGIFQPKWQNYIGLIVISPAGNIGSIPNFDMVIEPHSWLRGWSRITKFIFKMATILQNIENTITRLSMERFGWNMGGRIPSCCDMFPMMRLPWQWPLPSNGALYIQQLWASGGRTRETVLLKFSTQQQIRTTTTVTSSNIKIFKIQNGGSRRYGNVLQK